MTDSQEMEIDFMYIYILKLCVKHMSKYYTLYQKDQNKTAAHVIDKWLVFTDLPGSLSICLDSELIIEK